MRHAHGVVELDVVHALGAVGEVDGRAGGEEDRGALVGKRHVADVFVSIT